MNQTIPTTTPARRLVPTLCLVQLLRAASGLRRAAMALTAVLGLLAASCSEDPLAGQYTTPDDAATIAFAVAPRPGFTEVAPTRGTGTKAVSPGNSAVIPGSTRDLPNPRACLFKQEIAGQARNDRGEAAAPTTRAVQTGNATRWETGDILWLRASFYHDKQNLPATGADILCISALKYDGTAWRYLTAAEARDLGTDGIHGFARLLRWPREAAEWADPGMDIYAYYAGSGKPDKDGKLTINPDGSIPATPSISGGSGKLYSPGEEPVTLQLGYPLTSRVRIPAGYAVELTDTRYWSMVDLTARSLNNNPITAIPAQQQDTDVFLFLNSYSTATLTRDGVSCSFTFASISDVVALSYSGASYTLTPYTGGAQTPVAGYDLEIADEAALRAFAAAVNSGEKMPNGIPFAEARVLQTAPITLTREWTPIGSGSGGKAFFGAYNGNGHTITGLTITTPPPAATDGYAYAGLFGNAAGVLTGIHLRDVQINVRAGSGVSELNVGSIAGRTGGTLSLCSAAGTVNAGGAKSVYAGGIAGTNTMGTISRCRAAVETTAATTSTTESAFAGGIAGDNFMGSFILSCEAPGSAVTADGGQGAQAGGIAGRNNSSLIAFCRTGTNAVTARNATGYNFAGGLVGGNDDNGYLYSCYSRAAATATGSSGGSHRAGAIAGRSFGHGQVQHCYATGAPDQGTSDLAADPGNIVYNPAPTAGEIYTLMSGYTGVVESVTTFGTTYYPYTTRYDPATTPAYGITPLRVKWTSAAWQPGSDPLYPEIRMKEYEGEE